MKRRNKTDWLKDSDLRLIIKYATTYFIIMAGVAIILVVRCYL